MSVASLLAKERIVAPPGYNRWLIPPAALCVHLCIGQAYAFSVFNLPMTKLIGITRPAPGDWKLTQLGWIFSLAIFILGTSAALLGRWVEEGGPRKAMFTAALCFGGGFLVSALGPDRPGMAIMGFGGAAFIAAPLSVWLMARFSTPSHIGVGETFVVLGLIYLCFMMVGAAIVRVPAPGWAPAGYVAPAQPKPLVTTQHVYVYDALRTPQFWLIW
jgi:MFS family permease